MAAKRKSGVVLASWQQVDETLRRKKAIAASLAELRAEAEKRVESIRTKTALLEAEDEVLLDALEAFAKTHKGEFGKPRSGELRSRSLAHGWLGWRAGPPAIEFLEEPETVAARLRERGLDAATRLIPEHSEPVKEMLRDEAAFPDDLLKEVGARRTSRDHFQWGLAEALPAPA